MAISKAEVVAANELEYKMFKQGVEDLLDTGLKEGVRLFTRTNRFKEDEWEELMNKYRSLGWNIEKKNHKDYKFS